eukprot:scaffold57090_cov62-Phaeocystis_antarctica.AAC.2
MFFTSVHSGLSVSRSRVDGVAGEPAPSAPRPRTRAVRHARPRATTGSRRSWRTRRRRAAAPPGRRPSSPRRASAASYALTLAEMPCPADTVVRTRWWGRRAMAARRGGKLPAASCRFVPTRHRVATTARGARCPRQDQEMVPATAIFGLRRARLSNDFTGTRAITPGTGLTHADMSGAKLTADGGGFGDAILDLSAEADLLTTMSHDLLSALPQELQLLIADAVGDRCDRAALALASPRLLGLAACRELPSYQGLEMSLAFHHVLGGPIDEQSLRSYASRSEATLEGCEWLAWLAGVGAAGLLQSGTRPGRPGRDAPLPIPSLQIRVAVIGTAQKWYLLQPSSTFGALLRDVHLHTHTVNFEGGGCRANGAL